jgi:hypothetical protein
MAGTLLSLAARLERIADDVPDAANELKKKAAEAMLVQLVNDTPVDESVALSNWQIGNNRPVGAEIPAYAPGKAGSTAATSRAAAIAEGRQRIALAKPGEPIYLSNLLPYIRRLNSGWSKQAPAGFVEAAVMVGRNIIQTVRFIRLRK